MKKIFVFVLATAMIFALMSVFSACDLIEKGETIVKDTIEDAIPAIEISEDGYWVINGVKSNVKARGEDGKDGNGAATDNLLAQ